MTEFERMTNGIMAYSHTIRHQEQYDLCRKLLKQINSEAGTDAQLRESVLKELLGSIGKYVFIEPPFHCDYGCNISIGDNSYLNFGCTILDVGRVTIGTDVMIGPNVQIYTPNHPLTVRERMTYLEEGKPVTIGDGAWIGGGAIILPGVTVGEGAVVAAGSIVTKDVAPFTLVGGNPAKKIRDIEPQKLPEIRSYCGCDPDFLEPVNQFIRSQNDPAAEEVELDDLIQFIMGFMPDNSIAGTIRYREWGTDALADTWVIAECAEGSRAKEVLLEEVVLRQRVRGTVDLYLRTLPENEPIAEAQGFAPVQSVPESIAEIKGIGSIWHKRLK